MHHSFVLPPVHTAITHLVEDPRLPLLGDILEEFLEQIVPERLHHHLCEVRFRLLQNDVYDFRVALVHLFLQYAAAILIFGQHDDFVLDVLGIHYRREGDLWGVHAGASDLVAAAEWVLPMHGQLVPILAAAAMPTFALSKVLTNAFCPTSTPVRRSAEVLARASRVAVGRWFKLIRREIVEVIAIHSN